MAEPHNVGTPSGPPLSGRDLVLLPLIAGVTIALLIVCGEIACRLIWPAFDEGACLMRDPDLVVRWRSACETRVKSPESRIAAYRLNNCGYRSDAPCAPLAPGIRRIVSLGSSAVFGYWVDEQEAFPKLVAQGEAAHCGAEVDSQNLGLPSATLDLTASRIDEALRLHPSLVLVGISASEVFGESRIVTESSQTWWQRAVDLLRDASHESRFVTVVRHYLYSDRDRYVSAMLMRGEGRTLTSPLFGESARQLQQAQADIERIAARLRNARVPLVIVYLPDRLRAMLLKPHDDFIGLDPHYLAEQLAEAAVRGQAAFVDPSNLFAADADPAGLFFAADGHMNERGHALVGQAIRKELNRWDPERCQGPGAHQ